MRDATVEKCMAAKGLIDSGLPQFRACAECGITPQTYRNWVMAGSPTVDGVATAAIPAPKRRISVAGNAVTSDGAATLVRTIKELEAKREELVRDIDAQIDARRARLGRLLTDLYMGGQFDVESAPTSPPESDQKMLDTVAES